MNSIQKNCYRASQNNPLHRRITFFFSKTRQFWNKKTRFPQFSKFHQNQKSQISDFCQISGNDFYGLKPKTKVIRLSRGMSRRYLDLDTRILSIGSKSLCPPFCQFWRQNCDFLTSEGPRGLIIWDFLDFFFFF